MAMIGSSLRMDKHVARSIIADPPERDDSVPAAARPNEQADAALPDQVMVASRLEAHLVQTRRWSNWRQWLHDTHPETRWDDGVVCFGYALHEGQSDASAVLARS